MSNQLRQPSPVSVQVTWHAARTTMPDADTTVLIFNPLTLSDPVFPGWFDGEQWRHIDSMPATDCNPSFIWWADLPAAPCDSLYKNGEHAHG